MSLHPIPYLGESGEKETSLGQETGMGVSR